jgi:hypothetical protein
MKMFERSFHNNVAISDILFFVFRQDLLEATLENDRSVLVGEQRKNVALVQQLKDRDKRIKDVQVSMLSKFSCLRH